MTQLDTVEVLVRAMVDRMEYEVPNASLDETLSACFTLTIRTIKASIKLGVSRGKLRQAVEILLMECADETQAN